LSPEDSSSGKGDGGVAPPPEFCHDGEPEAERMLLEGVRVVEMAVWVAGPAAAGLLADFGADVVKIEPPGGDPMRRAFQAIAGIEMPGCPPFDMDNRGKRSAVIDTRSADGRALARRLALRADVFVSNLRRDALARAGLDWESLSAENPRLVYAHVTGYGQDGPDRDRAGYDIGSFWARSGIAHLLAHPGAEPAGSRAGFGDHITASHALAGILAALYARERTGRGRLVDACLLRSGMYTISWDLSVQLAVGVSQQAGKRSESAAPTVTSYRAGDGRWVWLLGVEADRHWPILCEALERSDLKEDPRFASAAKRRENARELMPILDAEFAKRPLAEWLPRFDAVDLWWAPVQTPEEVTRDPQAHAAGAFVEAPRADGSAQRLVSPPVRFGGVDTSPRRGVPALGEHTDAVLRELGLADAEIAALRTAGAIGGA
jgi:crotonobetainyl-CoA:carnitine CoA-transferase CaiB-like acyl-CoA transferase